MSESVMTEPIEYPEEDVFVSNLEDPATKYASLTKKAAAVKVAPTIEEEHEPQYVGSCVCWFGLFWTALCIAVITAATLSSRSGSDDAVTIAPSLPEIMTPAPVPVEPEPEPAVTDAPEVPEETVTPTEDEMGTTDPPETEPPVPETDAPTVAPTAAPVAATPEPTEAPETVAPTPEPTEAPETDAPTPEPTEAPETDAPTPEPTEAPETDAPTVAPTTAAPTDEPTAAPVAVTEAPTGSEPVDTTAPTARADFDLVAALPDYTQVALEDPTSPQSFAYLFVNYDPFVTERTPASLIQRFALATLYFGLGRMWTNGQVLPAQDECLWFADTGSFCNDDSFIEGLLLGANNLDNGPIPPEIGLLTTLKQVDMSDNFITGTIPTFLGQLQMLESLALARNERMFGTVPTELSSIATLQTLDLSGMEFLTGVIPEGVCEVETLLFECQPSSSLCGCDCECPPS